MIYSTMSIHRYLGEENAKETMNLQLSAFIESSGVKVVTSY